MKLGVFDSSDIEKIADELDIDDPVDFCNIFFSASGNI